MVSLLSERGRERLANSPVDFCSEQHGVTDFRGEVTLTYFHIMHVAENGAELLKKIKVISLNL